jgi:hypothetical protein
MVLYYDFFEKKLMNFTNIKINSFNSDLYIDYLGDYDKKYNNIQLFYGNDLLDFYKNNFEDYYIENLIDFYLG